MIINEDENHPVLTLLRFAASAGSRLDAFLLDSGLLWDDTAEPDASARGPLGECYQNAWHLAEERGWEYVEGYATTTELGIPLMHAWCINEDGDVVDPTWDDGENYFGVVIPVNIARSVMAETEHYGVLPNLWMCRDLDAGDVLFSIAVASGAVEE